MQLKDFITELVYASPEIDWKAIDKNIVFMLILTEYIEESKLYVYYTWYNSIKNKKGIGGCLLNPNFLKIFHYFLKKINLLIFF